MFCVPRGHNQALDLISLKYLYSYKFVKGIQLNIQSFISKMQA